MAKFVYNNIKNASSGYTSFELNDKYHAWILYKVNVNAYTKYNSVDKLLTELIELIIFCRKNLNYI